MNLQGKTVLITGASRGIGRAIALKLATAGGNIAFTYLGSSQAEIKETEDALQQLDIKVKGFYSDASDFSSTEQVINDVVQEFGSLDILVNNAGITRDNLLLRMTEQDWYDVLNVNLNAAFNTVKASIKTFLKQRSGSIINISSIVGIRGNAGQANYAASKAGIIGFTKSIALELGSRNIRANVIAPGFIVTDMTNHLTESLQETWKKTIPLNRVGLPEDVANCALFLASDLSSYITGQVIQVDGGLLT
ncbi:3-oxoacyl-[acyl-carrier-protein] reductase [Cardinium endosymbiont of Culicoides punctatus]|uniref:3-oxoacyl-[acyl-carrier-protein] reductase n=1 Tax=Cardinium endosymbiont of Culicoides punctatus TaxID=2304601 RepID=UPI001058EAF8|nr:3-oxoacyl-[acyl-carrier-protein] reductase [Cardinium endosymbiont of Culicoides punctatus]TDG95399.1 3-oxoacyl-[acyl-carrier-protein] reductase FabG [Cardinium endosymbiont of Culicoides punctatus]